MIENITKMLYDAYYQLYGALKFSDQCEANGSIMILKKLLRIECGREKALDIIEEQRKKAKFAALGDNK